MFQEVKMLKVNQSLFGAAMESQIRNGTSSMLIRLRRFKTRVS
jgi:hypothetical protein